MRHADQSSPTWHMMFELRRASRRVMSLGKANGWSAPMTQRVNRAPSPTPPSTRPARYSVRRAVTGSFFAAIFDGAKPAISVSPMEMHSSTMPAASGSFAMFTTPAT